MSQVNLPKKQATDNADKTKRYFNSFYGYQLEFPSNDVDAVIGFLEGNHVKMGPRKIQSKTSRQICRT
jgi:hypothetical protein